MMNEFESYHKDAIQALNEAKEHGMKLGRVAASGMIQQAMIMVEHDVRKQNHRLRWDCLKEQIDKLHESFVRDLKEWDVRIR